MAPLTSLRHSSIATAAWLAMTQATAQSAAQLPVPPAPSASAADTAKPTTQLGAVTVTGRASPTATIGGWGDVPVAKLPMQASVFGTEQLLDSGAQRLSDLVGADPAVSDAYNSEGYYDFIAVRGYVLDNRFNFRRDGLPINAETPIPFDNKAAIEILKGTSGMQAGTSAPGGLVNVVVKRPTDAPLRSALIEWRQPGTVTGAIDISQRFGADQAFGMRVNAAAAHLDPMLQHAKGDRHLLALAADWRVSADTVLEAEFETSHRSQPSQPGFSMLGDVVPAPGDPRLNLNNQPWSLPVVFDADTASLRWQQRLGADWKFIAHAATQRLRTDDRVAFPFGCSDPNPPPDGTYYADRYCPNGNFDLYDYRSDNERRRTDALDLSLQGRLQTGPLSHMVTGGVLQSRVRNRFQQLAYNFVGTGNVDGTLVTPSDPTLAYPNTNRDERSTELYLRDAVAISDGLTAWFGLRHTRLSRESIQTDGTEPTAYPQSFNTPWVAVSLAVARDQLVYASWGRGVESEVTPNRPQYRSPGQPLPALQSRQTEVGWKGQAGDLQWGLAWFDIVRPQFGDIDSSCDDTNTDACVTHALDGTSRHRGVEATADWHRGPWSLQGGAQWLHARRAGSVDDTVNGKRPTNVPAHTLRLQAAYDVAAVAGLNLQARVVNEGRRMVLPDNSASIPGWTRVDAAARYETRTAGVRWTWRAGIDNLFDKRAWRESPYQFSHVYLYPLAPRTLRLSVQADI
jgi:iron complex outermembrane receptor protein